MTQQQYNAHSDERLGFLTLIALQGVAFKSSLCSRKKIGGKTFQELKIPPTPQTQEQICVPKMLQASNAVSDPQIVQSFCYFPLLIQSSNMYNTEHHRMQFTCALGFLHKLRQLFMLSANMTVFHDTDMHYFKIRIVHGSSRWRQYLTAVFHS